jgi:hypothetical protein
MEFEALFLGLEPLTAIAVGVGAIALAPFVGIIAKAVQEGNFSQSISDSTRDVTKNTIIWGFDAYENAQLAFTEAGESFKTLIEDAKSEHLARKVAAENAAAVTEPRSVEIVAE